MATVYGNALFPVGSGTPNGVENANVWQYNAVAVVSGTKIQMSQLPGEAIPQFTTLLGMNLVVSAANTAAANVDVGYAAVDGDVTTTGATDLTYFANALDVHTAGNYGRKSTNTNVPRNIPKDAYPVITTHGATMTALLTLTITSRYDGSP